jgi:protein-S-isoprenylcysteine O-methyltransferase Ste14
MWEDYNTLLIFSGIGTSFSTLQDTSKTQNTLSKRVWENPKYGKIALTAIAAMALLFILTGMATLLGMSESDLKELSLGLIVFGIGMIGMLKAAIEMFENHRADKKGVSSNPGQPQSGK